MDDKDPLQVEQGRRLKAARLKAGFTSAAKAVDASPAQAKWKKSTYNAHERGFRRIGQNNAERYSSLFRNHGVEVTAIDLMFGGRKIIADARSLDDLADLVKGLAEEVRGRRPAHPAPETTPPRRAPTVPPLGPKERKK